MSRARSHSRKIRTPSYRLHKPTGQAVVTLNGHDVYLGKHDTAASQKAYDRVIAEWLAAGRQSPVQVRKSAPDDPSSGITVAQLVNRFRTHAETYYRRADGTPTSELNVYRSACRPLVRLYGSTPAADFGPKALKAVRQQMIDAGHGRVSINKKVRRIVRVFKWAVAEELIPPTRLEALRAVEGLRRGRSEAVELPPIPPVPAITVKQTLPFLTPTLRDMIAFHMLVGCRPHEVCEITTGTIDRSGDVWLYRPARHKTFHHGHDRVVRIGPGGQRILTPYLNMADPDAPLFSPTRSEAERRAVLAANRKTPLSCGNKPGSSTKRRGGRSRRREPGDAFTRDSYGRAIARACDKAFPSAAADELERLAERIKGERDVGMVAARKLAKAERPELAKQAVAERKANRWKPNQLRKRAATDLRERFGIDVAQTVLGHRLGSAVTEVYAEANVEKANAAVRLVG